MFEGDTNEDTLATDAVNLVTVKDTNAINTMDDWYRKRYKKVFIFRNTGKVNWADFLGYILVSFMAQS